MSIRSIPLFRFAGGLCATLFVCACTTTADTRSETSSAQPGRVETPERLNNTAERVTPVTRRAKALTPDLTVSRTVTRDKNITVPRPPMSGEATTAAQGSALTVTAPAQTLPAKQTLLPSHTPVPGGIALLTVGASNTPRPEVTFNDAPVYVTRRGNYWVAAIGIPLKAEPGEHAVAIKTPDHPDTRLLFEVTETQYKTQSLTIANKRKVNPNPDDQVRIESDWIQIQEAKNTFTTSVLPDLELEWPLKGRISSEFGLRRIYNGQPRNPHSGLDIAAPTGTPIIAPAPGTVIATGDYFFNGQTAFVDHGHGLVTMYCHMSDIKVRVGDTLNTSDLIGLVGATGRVTGPHLHLGVLLNGQMVNPGLLLAESAAAK